MLSCILLEINAQIILQDKCQNSEDAHLYGNKTDKIYIYLSKPESGAPQFLFNSIYLRDGPFYFRGGGGGGGWAILSWIRIFFRLLAVQEFFLAP